MVFVAKVIFYAVAFAATLALALVLLPGFVVHYCIEWLILHGAYDGDKEMLARHRR